MLNIEATELHGVLADKWNNCKTDKERKDVYYEYISFAFVVYNLHDFMTDYPEHFTGKDVVDILHLFEDVKRVEKFMENYLKK